MTKIRICNVIYLIANLVASTWVFAAEQQGAAFNITSTIAPPMTTRNHDGFEDLLAIELFTRLGLNPVINNIPPERGLRNLDHGIDDAILSRIGGLQKFYPGIVQINEAVGERKYIAYARKNIKINGWDDFKDYDVAYVKGWKIFGNNVKQYHSLTAVKNPEQLFTLLDRNRADVVLTALDVGELITKKLKLKDIHPVYPPLATKKKYFYLSKKHTDLAPRAAEVLRQIKADGTYTALQKKVFGKIIFPKTKD